MDAVTDLAVARSALAAERVNALSCALAQLGWECTQADIDMSANTARICFKHETGRLVVLDADGLGRVSVTREQLERVRVAVGRRGDRFLADRLSVRFIGRTRYPGIRSAMRDVAHYLADNAGVDRQLTRRPLAGLLDAAAKEIR